MNKQECAAKARSHAEDAEQYFGPAKYPGVHESTSMLHALLALYWQREADRAPSPPLSCLAGCGAMAAPHSNYCVAHKPVFGARKRP